MNSFFVRCDVNGNPDAKSQFFCDAGTVVCQLRDVMRTSHFADLARNLRKRIAEERRRFSGEDFQIYVQEEFLGGYINGSFSDFIFPELEKSLPHFLIMDQPALKKLFQELELILPEDAFFHCTSGNVFTCDAQVEIFN